MRKSELLDRLSFDFVDGSAYVIGYSPRKPGRGRTRYVRYEVAAHRRAATPSGRSMYGKMERLYRRWTQYSPRTCMLLKDVKRIVKFAKTYGAKTHEDMNNNQGGQRCTQR